MYIASHAKPLDLVEHERMRSVRRVGPVHFSGDYYGKRGFVILHETGLDRRCMASEEMFAARRFQIESIEGVARRVFKRYIQRFKIIALGLYLRPFNDSKPEAGEYRRDRIYRLRYGM